MGWLTPRFISNALADRRLARVPKEQIPLILQIANAGKDAVIRLANRTNDGIIEITDLNICELNDNLKIAHAYLLAESSEYRASILSASTNSSASSGIPSIFSATSHDTANSSNTGVSFLSATTKPTSPPKTQPRTIPTDFCRHEYKPWLCPTCGKGITNFSDLKRHLQNFCEKETRRWHCIQCGLESDDDNEVRPPCTTSKHHSMTELPMISKTAYGCAFCGRCLHTFDDYTRCIQKDQKKDRKLRPWPSHRLRGLLHQSNDIRCAVSRACANRNLSPDAWATFMWDDLTCDQFSGVLEYGCNTDADTYRRAIEDVDLFVEQLLSLAKFAATSNPVPPPKIFSSASHHTVAQPSAQPYDDLSLPQSASSRAPWGIGHPEIPMYGALAYPGNQQVQYQGGYDLPTPSSSNGHLSLGSSIPPNASTGVERVYPAQQPPVSGWQYGRMISEPFEPTQHFMHPSQMSNIPAVLTDARNSNYTHFDNTATGLSGETLPQVWPDHLQAFSTSFYYGGN